MYIDSCIDSRFLETTDEVVDSRFIDITGGAARHWAPRPFHRGGGQVVHEGDNRMPRREAQFARGSSRRGGSAFGSSIPGATYNPLMDPGIAESQVPSPISPARRAAPAPLADALSALANPAVNPAEFEAALRAIAGPIARPLPVPQGMPAQLPGPVLPAPGAPIVEAPVPPPRPELPIVAAGEARAVMGVAYPPLIPPELIGGPAGDWPAPPSDNGSDAGGEDPDMPELHGPRDHPDNEYRMGGFHVSAPANCETLFSFAENVQAPLFFVHDCEGSPFCLYACLNVATRTTLQPVQYLDFLRADRNPATIGTPQYGRKYATSLGVNLVIHTMADEGLVVAYAGPCNPAWRTAHLLFEPVPGREMGHYKLFCRRVTSNTPIEFPALPRERFVIRSARDAAEYVKRRKLPLLSVGGHGVAIAAAFWAMQLIRKIDSKIVDKKLNLLSDDASYTSEGAERSMVRTLGWLSRGQSVALSLFRGAARFGRYVALSLVGHLAALTLTRTTEYHKVREFLGADDTDKRSVVARRNPIETQDRYADVVEVKVHAFLGIPFYAYVSDKFTVSVVRFVHAYSEAQALAAMGLDPSKAMVGVPLLDGVNTNAGMDRVIYDTMRLAKKVAALIPLADDRQFIAPYCTYNAVGRDLVRTNIGRVIDNQNLGITGGDNSCVLRYTLRADPENVPIAVTPIPVLTRQGLLTAGQYPLTGSESGLGAFALRTMSTPEKDMPEVRKFVQFGRRFAKFFADHTDFSGLVEGDNIEMFRKLMKGKRPTREIERIVEEYEQHLLGNSSRKFKRCSFFVKFENSDKKGDDGVRRVKPRGIMTMSDLMLIELCQILVLIDRWNHGPFSRFQVKDLTPAEMAAKISEFTRLPHVTTDYSSFECFQDFFIRLIENTCLLRMCERAGFSATARAFRTHVFNTKKGRKLHTRWGIFKIFSRCSGDFWTSFGNGLLNACLVAYSAHVNCGLTLEQLVMGSLIVEGDDGLTRPEYVDESLMRKLGTKFSMQINGTKPGDCDFLRSRWIDGKRYLSVGKCFSVFSVKRAAQLKRSKQMFLLRCMGNSLYHLSPGHPVLTAMVNRIGRETAGFSSFKNYAKFLDLYRGIEQYDGKDVPREVAVDETMRFEIARGAIGFPPIPVWLQLELERTILHDTPIYISDWLNAYDEILSMSAPQHLLKLGFQRPSDCFVELTQRLGLSR